MADVSANLTLEERVDELTLLVEGLRAGGSRAVLFDEATQIWILIAGFLVFWMHAGFTMLEAGSVQHKNAVNILFKNLSTVAIGGIMYYLFGYAFAYGTDNSENSSSRFIGSGNYALSDATNLDRHLWFFQFAFAATGATIVSGAVAGRVDLIGYFLIAAFMTSFVYPVVSHWIWDGAGWISAFNTEPAFVESDGCGMIDYAGSGVVHMTGGVAALWAAFILGPRIGRFDELGNPVNIPPHNISMQALGVFILWFGWYGFNCGSTLAFDGPNASKVAVTTTLSPSAALVTAVIFSKVLFGHFDISFALNSALAGLVSITAGCVAVPDWASILIGIIGCFVYYGSSTLMKKIKIDDPVDAIAVHGFCGAWGCLAVGIFATPEFILSGYGKDCLGNRSGITFATQLVGVLAIFAWVTLCIVPFCLALKSCGIFRVPAEMEQTGLDASEHGGQQAFIGSVHKGNNYQNGHADDTTGAAPAKTEATDSVSQV